MIRECFRSVGMHLSRALRLKGMLGTKQRGVIATSRVRVLAIFIALLFRRRTISLKYKLNNAHNSIPRTIVIKQIAFILQMQNRAFCYANTVL